MRKLYRSSRDKKIGGVAGGVAEYLNVDPTLIRILLVIITVFSAGSVIIVYLIACLIIPREPMYSNDYGATPPPYGGGRGYREPPSFGGSQWSHQNQYQQGQGAQWSHRPSTPPPSPRGPAPERPRPTAFNSQPSGPQAPYSSSNLNQAMEDMEKKSLRQEIEELKAKIQKIEQDSKGE